MTRPRSKTDPGGTLTGKPERQRTTATPKPIAKSAKTATASQIPRFQGKASSGHTASDLETSSSTFNSWHKIGGTSRSYISEYISSSEADHKHHATKNAPQLARLPSSKIVGLGVRIESDSEAPSDGLSPAGRKWVSLRKAVGKHPPQGLALFGASPSKWNPSEAASYSSGVHRADSSQEAKRRHADLINEVTHIPKVGGGENKARTNSDCEYAGEDGLAITEPITNWNARGNRHTDYRGLSPPAGVSMAHAGCSSKKAHANGRLLSSPHESTPNAQRLSIPSDLLDKRGSKLPIVRQSTAHIPAALKRHSFYHPPSPGNNSNPFTHNSATDTHQEGNARILDAIRLASQASSIAEHERRVLGLPPSLSEVATRRQGLESPVVSHFESDFSVLDTASWKESSSQFSHGAQALLHAITNVIGLHYVSMPTC